MDWMARSQSGFKEEKMNKVYGSWKEYIEELRNEFTGKKVRYEGEIYTITHVDYNGIIHIDKPTEHNWTTAVYEPHEARAALI